MVLGAELVDDNPLMGLTLKGDPVAILRKVGRADIERRAFLTSAVYSVAAAALPLGFASEYVERVAAAKSGSEVGWTEIRAVRDMSNMFAMIDERHGGQHGRSTLVHYLTTDVATLTKARFASEEQRAEMLTLAACLAHRTGWKAHDVGEEGLAQRYYLQGYRLAREAGNDLGAAYILRALAHHGMDVRQPEHTLGLADRAFQLAICGKADRASLAQFAVLKARALGVAGENRRAAAEVRRAQSIIAGADEREMPYWVAQWGPSRAQVDSHSGKTLKAIGDYQSAEEFFARSAASRPSYRRVTALTYGLQAEMRYQQDQLEEACTVWGRMLDVTTGIGSTRTRKAVTSMRRALSPLRARGVPGARDLDERARSLLV